MNEKFAPELLESKSEIVECVMEQLEHMVRVTCLWTAEEEGEKRGQRGEVWSDTVIEVKCGLIRSAR